MTDFPCHTLESAPPPARPLLQSSIQHFGWIPNQSGHMATSPGLLEAYQRAHDLFNACSLDETERAVVWITVGREHACRYTLAPEVLRALIDGIDEGLPHRLRALRDFTRHVTGCRGQLQREAVAALLAAGFTPANLLDVVLGVAQKTMSTLLNSVAGTAIDTRFLDTVQRC